MMILWAFPNGPWAELVIREKASALSRKNTVVKINLNKQDVGQTKLILITSRFRGQGAAVVAQGSGHLAVLDEGDHSETIIPAILGPALVYPNPSRLATGTELGYTLSKHMDIDIKFYDMLANLILQQHFPAGSPGGQAGFNLFGINLTTFGSTALSAGVYFYILLNNGKVLGKGKLAVIP